MKETFMPGARAFAASSELCTEARSATGTVGWPLYGVSSALSWSCCQYLITRSAQVLIIPVPPTTKAQTSVTMPSMLCRSSHLRRGRLSRRTVPNSSLRMNGEYSTTPETIATSSSSPMKPRNSLPGKPANRSTCNLNITYMKPSSNFGCASTSAVRASTTTDLKSSVGSGVGVSVTNHRLSSSSECDANCTTRSGCFAFATSSTRSRLARGVSAGIVGDSTSVPSRCPIS